MHAPYVYCSALVPSVLNNSFAPLWLMPFWLKAAIVQHSSFEKGIALLGFWSFYVQLQTSFFGLDCSFVEKVVP